MSAVRRDAGALLSSSQQNIWVEKTLETIVIYRWSTSTDSSSNSWDETIRNETCKKEKKEKETKRTCREDQFTWTYWFTRVICLWIRQCRLTLVPDSLIELPKKSHLFMNPFTLDTACLWFTNKSVHLSHFLNWTPTHSHELNYTDSILFWFTRTYRFIRVICSWSDSPDLTLVWF